MRQFCPISVHFRSIFVHFRRPFWVYDCFGWRVGRCPIYPVEGNEGIIKTAHCDIFGPNAPWEILRVSFENKTYLVI